MPAEASVRRGREVCCPQIKNLHEVCLIALMCVL